MGFSFNRFILDNVPRPMPADLRSRLHHWLRWAVFAFVLSGLLWVHVETVLRSLPKLAEPALSTLEKRHLRLTEQVVLDLKPEFTRSFSEPLKRMVPHRTDGIAQPL